MEIIWHGHSCFTISNHTTIVTDPFDSSLGLKTPHLNADIVTVSHDNAHHNAVQTVSGTYKLLQNPGEYEIKDVFITGHALYPPNLPPHEISRKNIIFFFEVDGVTVCHMGDIRHVPTQSQMEAFDNVDVLLIPVGDSKSLSAAQASEVISIIEPALVIPMHYYLPNMTISLERLEKFMKEMGISPSEPQSRLKVTPGNLPPETQIVILTPQTE